MVHQAADDEYRGGPETVGLQDVLRVCGEVRDGSARVGGPWRLLAAPEYPPIPKVDVEGLGDQLRALEAARCEMEGAEQLMQERS